MSLIRIFLNLKTLLQNIEKLQRVYNSIEDMDTYMAMFAENLIPDTLVGPLLRCIIKKQFERWQRGDKFYYTFSNSGNPLTEGKFSFFYSYYYNYLQITSC